MPADLLMISKHKFHIKIKLGGVSIKKNRPLTVSIVCVAFSVISTVTKFVLLNVVLCLALVRDKNNNIVFENIAFLDTILTSSRSSKHYFG